MYKKGLILFFLLSILAAPLFSAKEKEQEVIPVETIRLSGEDSALIASKLSVSQNLVKSMMQDEIEAADLIPMLKECEKIFDSLKSSTDIKDPFAVKDMLLAKLAALESKAQERIYLHKRMNLLYQIMVVSGMLIIVVMIVYSIYMFSKRK
ncbi:MAG TPA: hypothetical protein PK514_01355 [Spirochaetota bacterium]|nr:hypothetical protein [Spirochaetota bacterium]